MMYSNPLEQFKIYSIIFNQYLTNLSIILILGLIIKYTIISKVEIIPSRWNIIYSSIISNIMSLYPNTSKKELFPIIFTVFSVILINNLLGMIPYSFTPTSHMSLTLGISLNIMIGLTLMANKDIFNLFVPQGTPIYLVPLLVGIEFISYISRAFSLSLRLTANISAGHCLILTIALLSNSFGFYLTPIIFSTVLFGLEVMVAILQAYVFTLLVCSYLNDILLIKSH